MGHEKIENASEPDYIVNNAEGSELRGGCQRGGNEGAK
jgi:hypothetical protein